MTATREEVGAVIFSILMLVSMAGGSVTFGGVVAASESNAGLDSGQLSETVQINAAPGGLGGSGTDSGPYTTTTTSGIQRTEGSLDTHQETTTDINVSQTESESNDTSNPPAPVSNDTTDASASSTDSTTTVLATESTDAQSTSQQVDVDPSNLAGSGTRRDPYIITNASELQAMEDNLTANYTLGSDIDASETAAWNGGSGFDPIGVNPFAENESGFAGSLDGANHTITGLVINRPSENTTALLGGNEGTVSDITLKNANVTGARFMGGLVGINTGAIHNATVSGNISSTAFTVGGVAGSNFGQINHSHSSANVTGSSTVGGFIGYNLGPIRNSTSSATVTAPEFDIGGFAGFNNGTMADVAATGSVSGPEFDAGGLVGDSEGIIIDATATVSVDASNGTTVGGLVGENENRAEISNSTAKGSVNGSTDVGGLVGGNYDNATVRSSTSSARVTALEDNVGGFVGFNNGTIADVAATGSVSGPEFDAGGLVGDSEGIITDSTATVSVDASNGTVVGGLVGENRGTIQNTIASGDVNGYQNTGGLVGFIGNGTTTTIRNATASGDVTGSNRFTGGLVGGAVRNTTIQNATASGDVDGYQITGGLVGFSGNDTAIRNAVASGNVNGSEFTGGLAGVNLNATIANAGASGDVNGSDRVGGLIGINDGGSIRNATASGSVSGNDRVGGLVGSSIGRLAGHSLSQRNSTIQSATASGDVSGSFAVGGLVGYSNNTTIQSVRASSSVNGSQSVGGLVGFYEYGTIQDGFATGRVTGTDSVGGTVGVVDENSTVITDVYWDEQATGQSTSAGSGIGLTTAQMTGEAARTNMSGLDFENTWTTTESYPQLRVLSNTSQPDEIRNAAPSIVAPSDATYDPTQPFTIGTGHNATGVIAAEDVAIRLVNATNGNDTVVAVNDSVPVQGRVNTTISAGSLSGNVAIQTQLYNTSSQQVVATDTVVITVEDSDPSPTGAYDFEGTGSTVVDRTGNGYTGELNGADRVPGRNGTVLSFDGSNHARLGSADTLNPRDGSYSVSLWFKTDNVSGPNSVLFAKRGGDNERVKIALKNDGSSEGKVSVGFKDDPGAGKDSITSSETYTDGTWHRLLAVRDVETDSIELYVDGELIGNTTDTQGDINPTGPAYLGAQPEYPNERHYTGQLDDVTVYKQAVGPESGTQPNNTLLKETFEANLNASGIMANDQVWMQRGGPCCNDPSFDKRLYTWDELQAGEPGGGLPTDTRESVDYTQPYHDQIGGNFMIQQSGGFGNFFSSFSFSDHTDNYPEAPYKPSSVTLRVGGNDHESGFEGIGGVELKDRDGNKFIRFEFPTEEGSAPFRINGKTAEADRNNGLYKVVITRINWKKSTFNVRVYRQTQTGYESDPVFSSSGMSFAHESASNLDTVWMHAEASTHVYLDELTLLAHNTTGNASSSGRTVAYINPSPGLQPERPFSTAPNADAAVTGVQPFVRTSNDFELFIEGSPDPFGASVSDDQYGALRYVSATKSNISDSKFENNTFSFRVSKAALVDLNASESDVELLRYDTTTQEYEEVDGGTTPVSEDRTEFNYEATTEVFSQFAIVVDQPQPDISVTDVSVSPNPVDKGENVTVIATVSNTGTAPGNRSFNLTVGGTTLDSTSSTINAGSTTTIEFTFTTSADSDTQDETVPVSVGATSTQLTISDVDNPDDGGGPGGGGNVTAEEPTYNGGAVLYVTNDNVPAIEIPFNGDVNADSLTRENFTLLEGGDNISAITGFSQQDSTVILELDRGFYSSDELEISLSGNIADSNGNQITNPGKKSVIFAGQTVEVEADADGGGRGVQANSPNKTAYQGTNIAINTSKFDTPVVIKGEDNNFFFEGSTGTNSSVFVFDTSNRELGKYRIFVNNSDDPYNRFFVNIRDLRLDVSVDDLNVSDDDRINTTISAAAGQRVIETELSDSDGNVVNTTVITLDGQGEADIGYDTSTADEGDPLAPGTYTVEISDAFTGISIESSEIKVTSGDSDRSTTNATLSATDAVGTPGSTVTVTFNLTNQGDARGFILDTSLNESAIQIVNQSSDGATWKESETKWLWQTVESNGSVTASLTVRLPESAPPGTEYTISAEALTADGVVATTNTTVSTGLPVDEAIDTNNNGQIDDLELLTAIEYWRDGTAVPKTGGKTIGDFQILDLIETWRLERGV